MAESLTKDAHDFIEKFILWGSETGLPRSMAKVLGYLMICEPHQQSAQAIQQTLQLSSGSVSNALSWLRHAGLIKKRVMTGTRHYLYEMEPDSWQKVVLKKLEQYQKVIELAEQGLAVTPGNPRVAGMKEVYELFASYGDEIKKQLIKR